METLEIPEEHVLDVARILRSGIFVHTLNATRVSKDVLEWLRAWCDRVDLIPPADGDGA